MRKIIRNILAFIAVMNMIWLFGFNYRIPSFISRLYRNETQSEEIALTEERIEETLQEADQEALVSEESVIHESQVREEEKTAQQDTQEVQEEAGAGLTCRPIEGHNPNIRSGPGSEYDIVGAAEENEVMTVTGEEENGWLPVRKDDGTEGYVFADIVTLQEQE